MAILEKRDRFDIWTICATDGITRASFVPELGAIGCSLVFPGPDGPRETLFQHDYFWNPETDLTRGGLPFLFPVCGRLSRDGRAQAYLYDTCLYSMKIHGFAHRMPWRVIDADTSSKLVLELSDNEWTRSQYPFRFNVRLTFEALPGCLICDQQYTNSGNTPLPYYAGFHPYFLTPAPGAGKSGVQIDLNPRRLLAYNSGLTDVIGEKPLPLPFPTPITDPEINEQLIRMGTDKQARLLFPDGFRLHISAESLNDRDMFPYLQLYTMADKPFFCVEPWMGVPNALNTVSGVRRLAPAQTETARLRIGVQALSD